jgi:hypothetical protein
MLLQRRAAQATPTSTPTIAAPAAMAASPPGNTPTEALPAMTSAPSTQALLVPRTEASALVPSHEPAARAVDEGDEPLSLSRRPQRDERGAFAPAERGETATGRAVATPSASTASSASSVAAPDIHVTIGRIDVRALMPSAPAPRTTPAPARPRLSLEQYLSERSRR